MGDALSSFPVNNKQVKQHSDSVMERKVRSRSRSISAYRADLQAFEDHGGLSPKLFEQFQRLIYHETGIWLGEHKTALLVGRLSKRLRSLRLNSMADYLELVSEPNQHHERTLMIDCITTNETHFFREACHFDFLAHTVFPRWREAVLSGVREPRVRIWSAGCSSGEEPYSLAMLLLDHFGNESSWKFEVVGTDISNRVLEKARSGIFSTDRTKDIPKKYLTSYVLKGTGEQNGFIKIDSEVQRLVTFSRVNLHADSYDLTGQFDLVFLRNVMIYFDQESKTKALARIERYVAPTGYLFVGHSESLQGLQTKLRSVGPSVYAASEHKSQMGTEI